MDERRDRLRELATGQDGQFATVQARGLGLGPESLRSWRQAGEIQSLRRGVWRFRVATGQPDAAVTALLLCWPHGVISHGSAAAYHGLTRAGNPPAPEVVVPLARYRRLDGVNVRVTRSLPREDVLVVGGLRYTSLARTVCDLAVGSEPWEALAILDDAVARGAPARWIHQRASALAAGRPGVAMLRRATGPDGPGAFRSWLERAAAHVYRVAAIPDPEWNVAVRDGLGLIGVVDALWRRWLVISEKEGLRFHTTPRQRRSDARRFNRLSEAGYAARRFGWEDVVHRPLEVATTVHRALRAAGADLDPATIPRRIVLPAMPWLGC
jgi:hypothetical protein